MSPGGSGNGSYPELAEAAANGAPPAAVAGMLLDILGTGHVPGDLVPEVELAVYRLASLRLPQRGTPQEDAVVRRVAGYAPGKCPRRLGGGAAAAQQ